MQTGELHGTNIKNGLIYSFTGIQSIVRNMNLMYNSNYRAIQVMTWLCVERFPAYSTLGAS